MLEKTEFVSKSRATLIQHLFVLISFNSGKGQQVSLIRQDATTESLARVCVLQSQTLFLFSKSAVSLFLEKKKKRILES